MAGGAQEGQSNVDCVFKLSILDSAANASAGCFVQFLCTAAISQPKGPSLIPPRSASFPSKHHDIFICPALHTEQYMASHILSDPPCTQAHLHACVHVVSHTALQAPLPWLSKLRMQQHAEQAQHAQRALGRQLRWQGSARTGCSKPYQDELNRVISVQPETDTEPTEQAAWLTPSQRRS